MKCFHMARVSGDTPPSGYDDDSDHGYPATGLITMISPLSTMMAMTVKVRMSLMSLVKQ